MIATKTISAIECALFSDQGNAYRAKLRETLASLSDAYAQDETSHRSHLGASLIGRECARSLWYTFRWAEEIRSEPRMVLLFNRGHLEEGRLVALLLTIGCEVFQFDENGKQFRISYADGYFGGGLDCVIRGCPDMPDEPILGEFKTHNKKSFEKLVAQTVRKTKVEHYVQMQMYMGYYGLRYALYLASCKDDDRLYAEIVEYNENVDCTYRARAEGIIASPVPPARISSTSSHYTCKFCDFSPICFGSRQPELNCRTCAFAQMSGNGGWSCGRTGAVLSKEDQLKGCSHYRVLSRI